MHCPNSSARSMSTQDPEPFQPPRSTDYYRGLNSNLDYFGPKPLLIIKAPIVSSTSSRHVLPSYEAAGSSARAAASLAKEAGNSAKRTATLETKDAVMTFAIERQRGVQSHCDPSFGIEDSRAGGSAVEAEDCTGKGELPGVRVRCRRVVQGSE